MTGVFFTQAAIHYLEEGDLEATTKAGHASYVNTIVASSLGDFDLGALTHKKLLTFINEQRERSVPVSPNRKVSDETIRRYLAMMSRTYQHCINRGIVDIPNPLKTFDRSILKKNKPRDRQLKEVQVTEALAALGPEQQRIVITLVLSGMRSLELRNLRWRQVDLHRKVISLGGLEDYRTKGKASRLVPINDALCDTLSAQKAELLESGDFQLDNYVFPSPRRDLNGRRTLRRGGLSSIIRTVREFSSLQGYTNHRLRHSFASWMLQQDVDPILIRDLLGHATLHTTTIYARHLSESVAHKVRHVPLPKLTQSTTQSIRPDGRKKGERKQKQPVS